MNQDFNLVSSPWISISGKGMVSLYDLFSQSGLGLVSGNPVEKIAIYKLLFAISQAAFTPKDEHDRQQMGREGFRQCCIDYLKKWQDRFDLYGDAPFLQMPAISKAREVPYSVIQNEISSGNSIRIGHYQIARALSEPEKATLLVVQMAMSLGGKKTDNSVILTPGYGGKCNDKGKPSTGKPGPGIAYMGLLHSFAIAKTVADTLWLNLLSHEQIEAESMFSQGMGRAPWEEMPSGEDCLVAQDLKNSLMGRLVPLSRFCLLTENGMHFSEGISHKSYLEGLNDPTVTINRHASKPKLLWADPQTKPWRELTSLLAFFEKNNASGFANCQLNAGVKQAIASNLNFAVWSGGLRVTSNAGEQFASGSDDYVESCIWLDVEIVESTWFAQLKREMEFMKSLSKVLYGSVCGYHTAIGATPSGPLYAGRATTLYWNLCEGLFQELVMACEPTDENKLERERIRRRLMDHCKSAYTNICKQSTARQVNAWAAHQPKLSKFYNVE